MIVLSWLYYVTWQKGNGLSGSNLISQALKSRVSNNCWEKRKSEMPSLMDIWCILAGFEDGEAHVPRNAGDLWELTMAPSWQPARKWGPQSCNRRERNKPRVWINLEANAFLEPPDKNPSLIDVNLLRPQAGSPDEPAWNSDLQNCETIKVCYFKPLHLK